MQSWQIGDVTITRIVEFQAAIPYREKSPFIAEARPEALAHLRCRFPGEGHESELAGFQPAGMLISDSALAGAGGEQVDAPFRHRLGLAGTGAGQDGDVLGGRRVDDPVLIEVLTLLEGSVRELVASDDVDALRVKLLQNCPGDLQLTCGDRAVP